MSKARDLADYISTGVIDTELDVLDGVTAGTVTASKALVVDANKDIASLRNITVDGTITLEGSTANDFETVLNVTDPTADRTITLPDVTGTVVTLENAQTFTSEQTFNSGIALADDQAVSWGGSSGARIIGSDTFNNLSFKIYSNTKLHIDNDEFNVYNDLYLGAGYNLVFEGATSNVNETTLTVTDPTADRTITLPDDTGIVVIQDALNGAVKISSGTTAQRPASAVNGMFRYNSTDGAFEGYAGGAWGAIGGGGDEQTASTSSTTQTAIATYTASTSLGIEITVIATDTVATERTITKLLVTHDGTTAVATQYGEVNTATAMASYDVDINGGNVRLLATAASANATNFTVNATILA